MNNKFRFQSNADKAFTVVNFLFVVLFYLIVLYPLIYVLSASISNPNAVITGKVIFLPIDITLDGYRAVFKNPMIMQGYYNSLVYMITGTTVNIILTILAAYPLSRKDFKGRNALSFLFIFTMLFNGGLIPTYIIVKDLKLLDTIWSMILPSGLVVWNMIITKTYFQTTIPNDLLEASQLDGCNNTKFLIRIVLPLSGPIIAVIALVYAIGHWNQYFDALLYLKTPTKYPLQLILREILVQNQVSGDMLDIKSYIAKEGLREQLKYALIVVASLPVMIIYPFVQKYFVKGIMIGALKG